MRSARVGKQDYAGFEVGSDLERVRVYRPESEVFSKDSLATFVGKPATEDHPPEPVNAKNSKKFTVGNVAARSEVVAKASALVKDPAFKGLSDLEIRTKAVQAVNGEEFAKDKSPAYIEAALILQRLRMIRTQYVRRCWIESNPRKMTTVKTRTRRGSMIRGKEQQRNGYANCL